MFVLLFNRFSQSIYRLKYFFFFFFFFSILFIITLCFFLSSLLSLFCLWSHFVLLWEYYVLALLPQFSSSLISAQCQNEQKEEKKNFLKMHIFRNLFLKTFDHAQRRFDFLSTPFQLDAFLWNANLHVFSMQFYVHIEWCLYACFQCFTRIHKYAYSIGKMRRKIFAQKI